MLSLLVKHGSINLSASIDPTRRPDMLAGSGGFGDVWRTELVDGAKVVIKTLRQQFLAHGAKKSTKVCCLTRCWRYHNGLF